MSILQSPKTSIPLQKYNFKWVTSGNNGNIYCSGNVGINTRSDPQYNLDVSGTSNISGNSLLRGNLTLLRDASFNGNLYVGQDIYIKNQKVTTGPSSQWTDNNGNIYYSGNVGINTRSDPQYNLDVSGTSNISGNSLLRGNLTLLRDASFNGNLNVGQNLFTNASPILSYTTVPTLTTNQIGYNYFASVTPGILCSLNTPTLLTSIANIPQGIYIVSYAVQFNTFTALPLRIKTRVGITLHGIEVQGIAIRNITVNDYDGISGCITYKNTSNNTFYLSIEVNQNGSCKTYTESNNSCYLSLTRIA
jgi:hypothetical protein